jgi:hypothetical protein
MIGIDERQRRLPLFEQQVVGKATADAGWLRAGADQGDMLRRKKRIKILNRHLIFRLENQAFPLTRR